MKRAKRGPTPYLTVVAAILMMSVPPAGASDTSVRWDNVSESSGCGEPFTRPPFVSESGWLSDSEAILGPFGTYFGRSIAEVRSYLVYWTVPNSGGKKVLVHEKAYPAFQRVADGLAEEAAAGRIYPIDTVGAFVPRTINGKYQLSRHALGTAIDMNYSKNPYREDGKLITDMPKWFVDVWRDAGFCWGGDWLGVKDPMHFSWMGPRATPETGESLDPIPPQTSVRSYGSPVADHATIFAPVLERYDFTVSDGTGNGAPDVVGLRTHPDGAVLDIASSTRVYGWCSIVRWFVPDSSVTGGDYTLLVDVDGDSRQDLVVLNASGSGMKAQVATQRRGYKVITDIATSVDPNAVAVTGADFNADHRGDLWAVSPDGTLRVFGGDSWDVLLHEAALPGGPPEQIAAADRDGGNRPELFALYPTSGGSRIDVLRLGSGWKAEQALALDISASDVISLGTGDYDGDGRADIQVFDTQGRLQAHLGNTGTGVPASRWFVEPDPDCTNAVKLVYEGTFFDDDGSVHVNGIEAIAEAGITRGCNPPFNDKYCPNRTLTRAEAATFMSRALGLPATSTDYFIDDDGHTLEGAINRIAEAGITKGCNPPANDRFCPNRALTRAEFAAFIARALNLGPAGADYFTDDNGHVLEGAINRIAEAGITKGCNPPENTWYCPQRLNTRGEAATFLTRAFGY